MTKGKRENKVCSNRPREKKNVGKVEPGSDFREQKFNYALCHCVFLIRATVDLAGTGHQSGLTSMQSPIQSGVASMVKEKEKGGCLFRTGGYQLNNCCGSFFILLFDKSQHLKASQRMKTHMDLILLMIYSVHRRLWSLLC